MPYTRFSDIVSFEVEEKRNQKVAKPGLRVIDEEEVHRLKADTPQTGKEPAPAKKHGSLRRQDRLPTATKEEMMAPQESTDGFDTVEAAAPLRIPPILLILVAVFFVSLLGIGVFLAVGGSAGKKSNTLDTVIIGNQEAQKEDIAKAQNLLKEINNTLEGYSAATTVAERLPYVRHPERVRPLMESFYEEHEFETFPNVSLKQQVPVSLGNRSFVVLTVEIAADTNKALLAEVDNDLKVRIDWESDVCYQPIPPDQIQSRRPTTPFDVRVFAAPDTLYVYDFADSARYQCLKLAFRDSEEHFFAYVEKETKVSQELFDHFLINSPVGAITPAPVILKVRYLPSGKGDNLLLIDEFVAPRWAFLTNPADE